VLCSLKTNATNENYRAVVSNPVNPQRPVLFVNSPKNWVQWWRLPISSTAGCTRFCLNARSRRSDFQGDDIERVIFGHSRRGNRHSEMVQCRKGLRLHHPRRRRKGRVRPCLRSRKIWAHEPRRTATGHCRCGRGSKGAGSREGSLGRVAKSDPWYPNRACGLPERQVDGPRCAMCGRLRVGNSAGRCSHVFGLFVRFT
jgi:hypothetical protein